MNTVTDNTSMNEYGCVPRKLYFLKQDTHELSERAGMSGAGGHAAKSFRQRMACTKIQALHTNFCDSSTEKAGKSKVR